MMRQRRSFVQYVEHVTAMQRIARGAIIRRRYKDNRQGAIKVQAIMRGAIERKRFKYVTKPVLFLQLHLFHGPSGTVVVT
jgi:myosin heavy subunit